MAKYVSIDTIFSKLIRDVSSNFNEGDVIEWCGEALEAIGAVRDYEETVAYSEVKNHQCTVPAGTHNIIQIARNNNWCGPKDDKFCPAVIKAEAQACACGTTVSAFDSESCVSDKSPDYIILDCNGQPLNDYNIAYYRPYFDLQYEYYNWRNSSTYRKNYSPVRLATSNYFNDLVCSGPYEESQDEYSIILGEVLRFSFESGSVAIAYNRQVVDKTTGYPLVPDLYSHKTAIVKYIALKMAEKDMYARREGSMSLVDRLDKDWQWYCRQASNHSMMPQGIDEHQNLLDQRSYILPRNNHYNSFFGKMAHPEQRKWNDPNNRNNNGVRYFLGN